MRKAAAAWVILLPLAWGGAPWPMPPPGLPPPWRWETLTGLSHWHTCRRGDTLRALAARYAVDAAVLARVNRWPVDRALPAGTRVWVGDARIRPGRPGSGLLINLPEQRLDVVLDGRHRASWPITIGAPDWPTPIGHFQLGRPVRNPSWHVPASIRAEFARHGRHLPAVVPPGPGNPLGVFWMGLGRDNLGIHAAPGPRTAHGSHGCLRLAPEHAWQLALWWRPGLSVDVVYLREKRLVQAGTVWREVHPDPYGWMPEPPAQGGKTPRPDVLSLWREAIGLPVRQKI